MTLGHQVTACSKMPGEKALPMDSPMTGMNQSRSFTGTRGAITADAEPADGRRADGDERTQKHRQGQTEPFGDESAREPDQQGENRPGPVQYP